MTNTFTIENFEYFLMILARISAFVFSAPLFSQKTVPRKVKAGLAIVISICVFQVLGYKPLPYSGTFSLGILIAIEVVAGLILGYVTNICTMILAMAGSLVDMEIGFSMAQGLNNVNNVTTTVTGNYYIYVVYMVMLISDMHMYIIKAIVDSFNVINVGEVKIANNIYEIMVKFLVEYFVIAFRIILPIFFAMLLTNAVLGILARTAPQLNMFVVGMQLKVIVGLVVLFFTTYAIPNVTNYIFDEIKLIIKEALVYLK